MKKKPVNYKQLEKLLKIGCSQEDIAKFFDISKATLIKKCRNHYKDKYSKVFNKKNGRPRVDINWNEFDELCEMQCTLVEISNFFKCSEDTIERACKRKYSVTFAEHYKTKSVKGKTSLRRKQFQVAMSGNVGMMIWLGKQWLGQKEKFEHSGDGDNPVKVETITSKLKPKEAASLYAQTLKK